MNSLTPMIKQYLSVKEKYPDAILFYRMGDFYEMFFEDAKLASGILDITLTSRDKNKEDSVPLCGIPYHAASTYIQKLIDKGHKIAICEQMEEPSKAKGIVRREVIRVITPGMILEDEFLAPKANNFLLAVSTGDDRFGLSFLDASTGDFMATEVLTVQSLLDEVMRVEPKEILLMQSRKGSNPIRQLMKSFASTVYTPLPEDVFSSDRARDRLQSLNLSFPAENVEALKAVGAILFYVAGNAKEPPRPPFPGGILPRSGLHDFGRNDPQESGAF